MRLFFAVAMSVSAIMAMLSLVGCSEPVEKNTDATRTSNYLALGDSYTIGEGVAPSDRWPMQLAASLRAGGANVDDPRIIAQTGWTCADLSGHLFSKRPDEKQTPIYAMVSLLIGVNDQYRGGAPEPYRKAFASLLRGAIELAGDDPKRVLVVSIPDWGATPFGQADSRGAEKIGKEIDAFNAINREEAERAGVKYVDITPVSREVRTNASLAADDGLHPSAAMYAKWTALVLPVAKDIVAAK